MISYLMAAENTLYPDWVRVSFPIFQIILVVLLLILSVAIVVAILLQSSTSDGMGAMAGQSTETFYAKNKGRTLQGLLKRLTIIFAIAILVITVLYLGLVAYYPVTGA